MSLFTKLLYLNLNSVNKPLENFFTEIVVCFFQHNQTILINWLKYHSIINDETYSEIEISPQKKYARLPNQNEDSIIDIQVKLSNEIYTDVIFIESKIGAKDGNNNLKKYAEILSDLPNFRHRILIYITRDYDPKEEIKTFASKSPQVSFYELRWHEFYDFLNNHEEDSLKQEILKFMEDNQMFQRKIFSEIDILSMLFDRIFDKNKNIIDMTLNDEIKDEFVKNFGYGNLEKPMFSKWKNDGLFTITKQFTDWKFRYFLGYFDYTSEDSTEYPNIKYLKLGVSIGVSAKYATYKHCVDSMDKVINDKPDKWIKREFDNNRWITIDSTIEIQKLLSGENHLSNIRKYFLASINELKEVHDQYFDWNSLTTEITTQEATKESES
ncbi:PD-(D/E)XK nuclease family protein [Okeanomitos corallinicola TIOX110]|uniref:PD-(D/E)XK nuclease family protein n=1 Tax=Okeanomitos corallinicola TIOX110 TaxID=3133117 RepID=A0ABZ2UXJ8_9CYAN